MRALVLPDLFKDMIRSGIAGRPAVHVFDLGVFEGLPPRQDLLRRREPDL
jgi:hypothetical protein